MFIRTFHRSLTFGVIIATFSVSLASCTTRGLAPATATVFPSQVPTPVLTPTLKASVTPTDTVTPTARPNDTPTPLPTLASFYKVHKCLSYLPGAPGNPWGGRPEPIYSMWCVLNVKIGPTGVVMLDVYWSSRRAGRMMYVNVPSEGPAAVYMMDNLGNKYDWTKRGGCALVPVSTQSGKGCSGWFTFPPIKSGARSLSFFYAVRDLAITDISLIGEVNTITPTPDS